ncbi:MATE family efflux transporter [Candidatus Poribacteria bacterium]|nr:MATE family efflux transporter [Candidatus Poribacteria bacterium]
MKDKKLRDLTEGSIIKNIFALALPAMVSNIFQTILGLIDMTFVSRLGTSSIAAVGLSESVMFLIMTVAISINIGTIALVARFVGAGEKDYASRIAIQSMAFGMIISGFLAFVGFFAARPLLELLGAQLEVIEIGQQYLRVLFLGIATLFLSFLANGIMQGSGDTFTPMVINGIAVAWNIIFAPLLIFGIGFFPKMGVQGAALATVMARGVGFSISLFILVKGYSRLKLPLSGFRIEFRIIWRIIRIALPSAIEMLTRSSAYFVFMKIVAIYGTVTVAAYVVGGRLDSLVWMPGFALATASSTLVGQNLGAGKPERAERSAWTTVGIYVLIMFFFGIIFYILAPTLIGFFDHSKEVIQIGTNYLRITVFGYLFLAAALVLSRSLNGAGDTISPMLTTFVSSLGAQTTTALLFLKYTNLASDGLWLAMVIATVVHATIISSWFKIGRWKHKSV